MSVFSRGARRLISLMAGLVLLAAIGFEVFQWTYCYWYVDNGNSLLLTYKGPPLPIWGFALDAAPEGQLAEVDAHGRPKQKGILAEMVGPGRHFYFPLFWECEKVPDVLVEPGSVAIVISRGGIIDYCFMSEALKEIDGIDWLKKREGVPRSTATFAFNQIPDNIQHGVRVEETSNLQNWFGGKRSIEISEDVVGLGKYNKTLTVLYDIDIPEADEEEVEQSLIESWTPRFKR